MLESLVYKRYTDNTICDIDLLESQIERIAVTKVGTNNEEFQAGVIGIAVPVMDAKGRMIASVALQAPVARLSIGRALEFVPSLQRAAADMVTTFEPADA
jgi:IclR family acetate operon transcriptional repressor